LILFLSGLAILLPACISSSEQDQARTAQDSIRVAKKLLKTAGLLMQQEKTDSALLAYKEALAMADALRNDSLIAKSRNGIAGYYLRHENYPKAIEYLTSALKSSEKAGYKHCTGLIYNGFGLVSISMHEYDKAITWFRKAKEICHETGDTSNEAGISLNIANCYAEISDFVSARDFYQENLDVLRKTGDTAQIVLACINLATVNRNLGDLRASFRYLEEATMLLARVPDQSLLCTALLETGSTYLAAGNLALARDYFNRGLATAAGTLSKSNSMEALSRLASVEEREGNWRGAYDYFRRYTVIKDSVMNDETRRSIAEIRLKADVQKQQYENELLGRRFEIQKRRTQNLWFLFGAFFLLSVMTGILIWLSHKNLRKSYKLQELANTHLEERIDLQNRELTSTSLQLVTKNKLLSDISKMASEYYDSKSMDKASHAGLQKLIRENLNTDRDWEQFKELFEKVHRNFFTGLKSACPELTENELRLCAYLKINLQNKEIAKMLNVDPATVTTSRYRIRKKLKLDTKTVLEDFLRAF
jgi:tetratricopeptide (TPR) repeat protein